MPQTAAAVWKTVRYRPIFRELFAGCIHLGLRWHFSGCSVLGNLPELPAGRPWIFAANHISWWDGFILWALQRKLAPERKIYTVMLAEEYQKQRWFRWVGALPLTPGSPSSLRYLLRFTAGLSCSSSPFILSIFPQGEIRPMAERPIKLQRGWFSLLQTIPDALVIPLGLHIEPGHQRCPKIWIRLGKPLVRQHWAGPEEAEKQLHEELENALQTIAHYLSHDPQTRESASAHTCLL